MSRARSFRSKAFAGRGWLGGEWRTAAALALGYVVLDWLLLPEAPRHIAYCISAETGNWAPAEFAHPLFVPVLAVLKALLSLFGWEGRLLLPCQALNVAAGGAALGLVYLLTLRFSGKCTYTDET